MARVRTPLISFGASGKIARTIVFFAWKGIDVAREYVVPSNPRTAAQTTQRNLFTDCVAAFRNYLTDAGVRTAWNLLASAGKQAMSGFNRAMESMLAILKVDPASSYVISFAESGQVITFILANMNDGTTGTETGDFEIWKGTAATSLLKFEEVAIVGGAINTTALGAIGDVIFCELRKGMWSRSGIVKVTLT